MRFAPWMGPGYHEVEENTIEVPSRESAVPCDPFYCTPRNLLSLVRSIMLVPRFEIVADFLLQAQKKRRQFRQIL